MISARHPQPRAPTQRTTGPEPVIAPPVIDPVNGLPIRAPTVPTRATSAVPVAPGTGPQPAMPARAASPHAVAPGTGPQAAMPPRGIVPAQRATGPQPIIPRRARPGRSRPCRRGAARARTVELDAIAGLASESDRAGCSGRAGCGAGRIDGRSVPAPGHAGDSEAGHEHPEYSEAAARERASGDRDEDAGGRYARDQSQLRRAHARAGSAARHQAGAEAATGHDRRGRQRALREVRQGQGDGRREGRPGRSTESCSRRSTRRRRRSWSSTRRVASTLRWSSKTTRSSSARSRRLKRRPPCARPVAGRRPGTSACACRATTRARCSCDPRGARTTRSRPRRDTRETRALRRACRTRQLARALAAPRSRTPADHRAAWCPRHRSRGVSASSTRFCFAHAVVSCVGDAAMQSRSSLIPAFVR